jgi:hypothetical protein
LKKEGNATVNAVCDENIDPFSQEWNAFQKILRKNPLAILD